MAGVDVRHGVIRRIENAHEHRDVGCRIRRAAHLFVQPRDQIDGILADLRQSTDTGQRVRHEHGRTDAVADDVTQDERHAPVRKLEDVVQIAADLRTRLQSNIQFVALGSLGFGNQHRALDSFGRFHLLLHAFFLALHFEQA